MLILIFEYLVISVYLLCLLLIVLYSIGQLHLVFTFYKYRKHYTPEPPLQGDVDLPFVTIQLPIYNELYVVDRLLSAIGAQDYPKDCFEIQVLDDSDDETVEMIAKKVAELKEEGIQIHHIRRPDRVGYKAGALAYGMDFAKGKYISIFDADFVPHPNYLRSTIAQFTSDDIGVVQARWEHINQHYSLFTEIQAFHLDAHFTIEQFGRCAGGYYLNFNGTAGVWRKETIIDAGGWHADTLTEDLDLSYRAQMKGWKFRYVDEIGTPAELPAEMGAIKSQQYRWMKGGAEVARKMLRKVWQSEVPLARKLHATMHLMSSSVFTIVLVLGACSVPLLYVKHSLLDGQMGLLVFPISLLIAAFIILAIFYLATMLNREKNLGASLKRLGLHYIPFLALSMGLSLHNSIAVIQGFRGKKTPFIRTPKFNIIAKGDKWKSVNYRSKKVKPSVYAELLMALYFCGGILMAFYFNDMAILPFLIMQCLGFGVIGFFSFKHAMSK